MVLGHAAPYVLFATAAQTIAENADQGPRHVFHTSSMKSIKGTGRPRDKALRAQDEACSHVAVMDAAKHAALACSTVALIRTRRHTPDRCNDRRGEKRSNGVFNCR